MTPRQPAPRGKVPTPASQPGSEDVERREKDPVTVSSCIFGKPPVTGRAVGGIPAVAVVEHDTQPVLTLIVIAAGRPLGGEG